MTSDAPTRLLVVAGSLRAASLTGMLARLAATLAPAGIEAEVFDGLSEVEPFDEDMEEALPPGAGAWRDALRRSDAVFFVTPEYNASIPGQLKNAIDWASRAERAPFDELAANALYGRPVAVASASTGQFGGVWAAQELAKVLKTAGARVVDGGGVVVALPQAHAAFGDDGRLSAGGVEERIVQLVDALASQVAVLRAAGVQTSVCPA